MPAIFTASEADSGRSFCRRSSHGSPRSLTNAFYIFSHDYLARSALDTRGALAKRHRDKWGPKADEQGWDVTPGDPAKMHPRVSS